MERDSLKDLARCDSATVKLGGVEDYHIARAEGVEAALDTDLAVSAQKKQEDKRGVIVKLSHQRVFVRVSDRVVNAAGGIAVVAHSR